MYVYVCMYSMTFFIQNYSSVVAEFLVQYVAGFKEHDTFKKQEKNALFLVYDQTGVDMPS